MDVEEKLYLRDPFSGTMLFYRFCRWLFKWKWVLFGIGCVATLLMVIRFSVKNNEGNYTALITSSMLPDGVIQLQDVEAMLSVQLKGEEQRENFRPRILSSKVTFNKEFDGKTPAALEVELKTAKRGNVDTIAMQLGNIVFHTKQFRAALSARKNSLALKLRTLDTLIALTRSRLDVLGSATLKLNVIDVGGLEFISLNRELNSLAISRVITQAELDNLSRFDQIYFACQKGGKSLDLTKCMLQIVAVWLLLLFVAGMVWGVRYFYDVSERIALLSVGDNHRGEVWRGGEKK